MRKSLLAGLMASGLLACKTAQPSQSSSPIFDLAYQKITSIAVTGGPVQARLTEVNESRCPADVNCITAGNVTATIDFTATGTVQTVRLGYDRNYRVDSVQITLHKKAYWLRLLDVSPYPRGQNGNQPKVATLRLRLS